jgi:hypothetical protein
MPTEQPSKRKTKKRQEKNTRQQKEKQKKRKGKKSVGIYSRVDYTIYRLVPCSQVVVNSPSRIQGFPGIFNQKSIINQFQYYVYVRYSSSNPGDSNKKKDKRNTSVKQLPPPLHLHNFMLALVGLGL